MATGTLGSSARDYHTRQTHYVASASLTATTNFAAASGGAGTSIKIGTVPSGAYLVRAGMGTTTVFNSATTNTISLGTAASGATLFASAAAGMATLGFTAITLIGTACGPFTSDTDIYATNTSTGTVATTGQTIVHVEYIVP